MWQEDVTAIATATYAIVSVLLLGGVAAAFLQLRALRRGQQLEFLGSALDVYRSREMMEHVRTVVDWARDHGEEGPRVYCEQHSAWSPEFRDLHDHRRQLSQFVARLALPVYQGLLSERFVVGLTGTAIDSCRFILGIEWRMVKQISAWDGSADPTAYQRWPLFELFISYIRIKCGRRYARFRKKSWWTPVAFIQRRQERAYTGNDLLPRYRRFLTTLSVEPGYEIWARAALRAVDEPLTEKELRRGELRLVLP